MTRSFKTFREVIDAFETTTPEGEVVRGAVVIERELRLPRNYGYGLWNRDSIAPSHWDGLIALAAALGISGITDALLRRLYAERRQRGKSAPRRERKTQFGALRTPCESADRGGALERASPTPSWSPEDIQPEEAA